MAKMASVATNYGAAGFEIPERSLFNLSLNLQARAVRSAGEAVRIGSCEHTSHQLRTEFSPHKARFVKENDVMLC